MIKRALSVELKDLVLKTKFFHVLIRTTTKIATLYDSSLRLLNICYMPDTILRNLLRLIHLILQQPHKVSIIIPALKMRKLRCRKIK